MDSSNLSAACEMNGENSNFMFPLEDNNMLEKLRSCSIIPKKFSEFQIFVHTLTGNSISDDIIQEAWKHIYVSESHEERNSNSSIGLKSSFIESVNTKYQTPILRNNTSKITQNSGKIRKKMFSPQSISISQHKDRPERKNKIAGDSSKQVEVCGNMAAEKNNSRVPLSIHDDVANLVTDPQPSDSILGRVKKRQCSSNSVSKTINQMKVSYSVNEIGDYLDKSDLFFSDVPSKSNDLITNHTLDNDCGDKLSLSRKEEYTLKKKVRKNSTPHVAISSKQAQVLFPSWDNAGNANDYSSKDEDSSDCEVIEIVSLNKSTNNDTDDSESELDKPESENEKSDSDCSIEILETQCSIKQLMNKNEKTDCPLHGENNLVYPNSCGPSKSPYFIKDSFKTPKHPEKCSHLCFKENKTKVERKKKKDMKYKSLKNEVKTLKSLLIHLLTSLQNTSTNDNHESSESIPCLLKKDLLNRLQGNCDQTEKSNGSFIERRKKSKSKVESSQKIKTPSVMDDNTSIKDDRSNQRNQQNAKNIEGSDNSYKLVQKVDVETSTSDGGKKEKFMWREIIVDTLKSRPERQMPIEKLKRLVIAKYYLCRGNVSKNTTVKFFRYLRTTAGVIVDRDIAIYSSKPNKISSMSDQRKQFVLKTVTTTKEYKMS